MVELERVCIMIVACLVQVGAGRAASAADGAVAPAPKRLVLADFDGPGAAATDWRTYADPDGDVRHRLVSSQRDSGNALHLAFAFPSAEPCELGFRMGLPAVDASEYDHLGLWVKGDAAAGYASTFKVALRRPDPRRAGLLQRGSYVITGITPDWRHILIPLNLMTGITDWKGLTEFVVVFQSRRAPERRGGYYIDDVALVKTGTRGPSVADPVIPPRKQAWEASVGGRDAAKPHLRARLAGWPEAAEAKPAWPADDREFLWRIARDTWRGIEGLTDREHGLPVDHVRFGNGSVAVADAEIGDYTNVTNVGLFLVSVVAAHEIGLLPTAQALEKLTATLGTLERLERHAGFFFNYYDTTTLERSTNFVSFVDSSWLTAGLMVVRMSFPELHARCSRLIDAGDYGFFYDDVEQHMLHGYHVNLAAASEYRYGLLYTEARIGSLIAIGKGDVPAEHWFRLVRTFPASHDWQTQTPTDRKPKTVRGHRVWGGHYRWKGIDYVPSWGGSMFEALMPTLLIDERQQAPRSLGRNDEVHATVQRRHAVEDLGYAVWGMSPSATPGANGYGEFGATELGVRGYDAGVVTPHATALALDLLPTPAAANLRRLGDWEGLYGEYGFYDAVDPVAGTVARAYLALDQAMTFIALANHLQEGCMRKRFASDPIARAALPLIADEDFFD
jgi:hypothetical protein